MRNLTIGGLALLGCAGIAFLAIATNLVTVVLAGVWKGSSAWCLLNLASPRVGFVFCSRQFAMFACASP
jgi:hypothetical protein